MVEFQGIFICVPLYAVATLLLGGAISAGLFVFHVVGVPLIFKYSETFRRSLVFANFVQWPPNVDMEDPSASGLDGARNLSLQYDAAEGQCTVRIGIWHVLPKSANERLKGNFVGDTDKEDLNKLLDDELANSKVPIMLYCHGNSNSRAASHRIQLYKFFQQMDYHTIAFDYRGYGDSSNLRPSESGVVEDTLMVYQWLHDTLAKGPATPPVFVWGHSLGTGISSHLIGNLKELSTRLPRATPLPPPNGLILEAPFNNLADEVAKHPLSKLVTWLPYHEATFVRPFRVPAANTFRSDEHLARARSQPMLILHAKDDVIVPFVVGLKLYRSVLESRAAGGAPVTLHAFDKTEKLGHKWICNAANLSEVLGEFVRTHR